MYDWRIFLIFGVVALLLLVGMDKRVIGRSKRANAASGPNLADAVLPLLGFIFFGLFFLIDLAQSLRRETPTTMESFWGTPRPAALLIEVIVPATVGVVFLVFFVRSVVRALRRPKRAEPAPTAQPH